MARDLSVSTPTVFAAFSAALVVSALLGLVAFAALMLLHDRSASSHQSA